MIGAVGHTALRAESFNLLNRTNFGAPDGDHSSGAFGTIRSTYPARQLQFALRLAFGVLKHQNVNRPETCTSLGPRNVPVILPKLVLVTVVFGVPKCVRLNAL